MRAAAWAIAGALAGACIGVVAFAPASWLADAISARTDARFVLAQARGTVWSGSAVALLTGGPGSRDAAALPGRLAWRIGWRDGAVSIDLQQACCLNDTLTLQVQPGFDRLRVALPKAPGGVGHWPAAWLAGLGTPWNTLDLNGSLRLATDGFAVENVQGRWRVDGSLQLDLADIGSRVSTLPVLGSYRFQVEADADHAARLTLRTLAGALRLQGSGSWTNGVLRFRGDARAADGSQTALDNLLNIIGRREGALSLISIG